MGLFRSGQFKLHSGSYSPWKIDLDSLDQEDLWTLSIMLRDSLPHFGQVIGVPSGGLKIAIAMRNWISPGHPATLIVDDVLTTGTSMEEERKKMGGSCFGAVIFARGPCPDSIFPLFQMAASRTFPD